MIKRIRSLFTVYFNSQTEKIISSTLFDNRKLFLQNKAIHSIEKGLSDISYFDGRQLIVSLTTYSKRLYEVYLTIESIMQQIVRPNKIILWLADDIKDKDIPQILRRQEDRGLEIRYYRDIKSYKKLIPSLKAFPDDFIITVDDDVIYDFDMIDNLIKSYIKSPGFVYGNRVKRMTFNSNNQIECYDKWSLLKETMEDSPFNMPTGVGGVLYPPHCFTPEVFNEEVFMKICGNGDDIWFKAMCLINGIQSRLAIIHEPVYYENQSVQNIALYNTNVGNADNDKQLNAVFERYNIYKYLF